MDTCQVVCYNGTTMNIAETPNTTLLDKSHGNKWVACSDDYLSLVAVGDTLDDLNEQMGGRDVVVMKVLPVDGGYTPSNRT